MMKKRQQKKRRIEYTHIDRAGMAWRFVGPEAKTMSEPLSMWTIYDRPSDYPNSYVVRRWEVGAGTVTPASGVILALTLDEARLYVPSGLHRLPRMPGDDPVIVETWV